MPRAKTKPTKVPKAAPKAPARIPAGKPRKAVAPSDRVTRRQARLNSDPEQLPAPPPKPAKKAPKRVKRAPPPPPPPFPELEDDGEEWLGVEDDVDDSEEELEHIAVKPRKSILRAPRKRALLRAPKTKPRASTPGPVRSRGRSRESSSSKGSSSGSGRSGSRSSRSSSRRGRSSSASGSDKHVHFEDDDWVDEDEDVDALAKALYENDERSDAFSAPSGSEDVYSALAAEDYDHDAMLVDEESDEGAQRRANARE